MAKEPSEFEGKEPERGSRAARRLPRSARDVYGLVTLAVVCAYAAAAALIALPRGGSLEAYGVGLVLLVLLAAVTFICSLREPRGGGQRFYLTLSLLPVLTIARLAFADLPLGVLDPLFVYLLLAIALLSARPTMRIRLEIRNFTGRQLSRAVLLGAVLAAALAILAILLPIPMGAPPEVAPPVLAFALAPVALLDELWFRGILQPSVAQVTATPLGWIATAAVFTAYGVPFSTPAGIAFRAGYGLLLGVLAIRRDNLPIPLVARTAMVAILALLSPAILGSGMLV